MKRAERIALDTEADSLHHYYQKVCLLQLTVDGENYLVDPLVGVDLSSFLHVLSRKPLILHGGEYDLRMLRSSFGFRPQDEIFDTCIAAQLLGYEQIGLVALVERFLDVPLSKKGQKSNWARRPLTPEQLHYATDDTHYLTPLADLLYKELAERGRLDWHRESCARMVVATAQENARDPEHAWRIKGLARMTRRQLAFVRSIWHWREKEAQDADRPPFKVMSNALIVELSTWAESNGALSLKQGPKLPRDLRGPRLQALKEAIREARKLPESQWPKPRPRKPTPQEPPGHAALLKKLSAECSRVASELAIDPAVIAPRATLSAIAHEQPRTVKQMMRCGSMMRWQAELLAEPVQRVFEEEREHRAG